MPLIIDAAHELDCDSRVTSIAIDPAGKWLAWGSEDGGVRLIDISGDDIVPLEPFSVEGGISHLAIASEEMLIVGTYSSNISGHERLGGHRWTHTIGGGCDHLALSEDGSRIVCIDGTRVLHILNDVGTCLASVSLGELNRLCVADDGSQYAVADDDGMVTVLNEKGKVIYQRSPEQEDGEKISAMSFLHDGSLLLCREALGLTPADVHQIALEKWSESGSLIGDVECSVLATSLTPRGEGAVMGCFDGRVFDVDSALAMTEIWKNTYTINAILCAGDDLMVASWFHLFCIDSEGEEKWRCEHNGLVEQVCTTTNHSIFVVRGDDQNDYTRDNRIMFVDPTSKPYLMRDGQGIDADLLEFDDDMVGANAVEVGSDIYADDSEEISALLTDEERAMMEGGGKVAGSDDLISALDDEIEVAAMLGDTESDDDILAGLSDESFVSNLPPEADAGDDQIVDAEADGTSTIILDGSRSFDRDGAICQWTWRDGSSRQIGTTPKVKVRLRKGNHTFTLTVADDAGTSTTDAVTVQVR